jgi:hypothetical protein
MMGDKRNQAEILLNEAMDHIAGTLEQPGDMRAWDHLLIYCPREALERRLERMNERKRNGVLPGEVAQKFRERYEGQTVFEFDNDD